MSSIDSVLFDVAYDPNMEYSGLVSREKAEQILEACEHFEDFEDFVALMMYRIPLPRHVLHFKPFCTSVERRYQLFNPMKGKRPRHGFTGRRRYPRCSEAYLCSLMACLLGRFEKSRP